MDKQIAEIVGYKIIETPSVTSIFDHRHMFPSVVGSYLVYHTGFFDYTKNHFNALDLQVFLRPGFHTANM